MFNFNNIDNYMPQITPDVKHFFKSLYRYYK